MHASTQVCVLLPRYKHPGVCRLSLRPQPCERARWGPRDRTGALPPRRHASKVDDRYMARGYPRAQRASEHQPLLPLAGGWVTRWSRHNPSILGIVSCLLSRTRGRRPSSPHPSSQRACPITQGRGVAYSESRALSMPDAGIASESKCQLAVPQHTQPTTGEGALRRDLDVLANASGMRRIRFCGFACLRWNAC